MKTRIFDEEDKKTLVEELDKLKRDYLNLLELFDEDEDSRNKLFVITRLKNVIEQNMLDDLYYDENNEQDILVV